MTSLLCARQYFKDGNAEEKQVAASIDKLWKEMEFDWYRRGGRMYFIGIGRLTMDGK